MLTVNGRRGKLKNILFAGSEGVPFIKSGGLADVIGSLPKEIDSRYFDVRIFLPKYRCMKQEMKDRMEFLTSFYMDFDWRNMYVGILTAEEDGIRYYFIDNEDLFNTDTIYTGDPLFEIRRFAFFCKAVLSALPLIGFRPDVIHCNDWQTGLIPVYLKERFQGNEFYRGIRTVMTIHNLKFQGRWNIQDVENVTGLSGEYFTPDKLEAYQDANLLKGGIVYADAVTTVSPSYAEEIRTPFYGEGLDGLLNARSGDLRGIVNGIDCEIFDPASDSLIPYRYTAENFRKEKARNKKALQKELGLPENTGCFMVGIV